MPQLKTPPTGPEADGLWHCPECGKTYPDQNGGRALKRHLTEAHAYPPSVSALRRRASKARQNGATPMPVDEDSVSFKVETELRALLLPIETQVSEISRRLVGLQREASDLRAAKARLERTIKYIKGEQAPANGAPQTAETNAAKRLEIVQEFLRTNPHDDGFTATELQREMHEQGIIMSPDKTKKAIETLHDRGIVRIDKVVRGGANQYLVIGRNGG